MKEQKTKSASPELKTDISGQTEKPLTFKEARDYLGFSSSYLYKLTSLQLIPHYKPSGKVIFFSKEELRAWVYSHRILNKQTTNTKQ